MRRLFALLSIATLATGCNSTLAQRARTMRSPVHAVFSADIHDARIFTDSTGIVAPARSTVLLSLEGSVQPVERSGIGIAGRILGLGEDAPSIVEGSVLLGSRRFALDVGLGSRTGVNPQSPDEKPFDDSYAFAKIGVRSGLNLGRGPLSVQFRAARHVGIGEYNVDTDRGAANVAGWVGETSLSWTRSGFPLTGTLGYRVDRFEAYGIEQETSALTVGVGLMFGRR